jgi:hypothetical protein
MVDIQLVDTTVADETIILNCSLEKYIHVCGLDISARNNIVPFNG